jgi:hypothetical protein
MVGKNSKLLHPYSAGLLIFIDNIFWGINALTLGLSTPIISVLAFSITGIVVFLIQKFLAEESVGKSFTKAFFTGVLAGIPTSLAGTALGTAVLLIARSTHSSDKNKKLN